MHLLSAHAMISRYNEVRFFSTTFDTFRYTFVIKYSTLGEQAELISKNIMLYITLPKIYSTTDDLIIQTVQEYERFSWAH